MQISGNNYASQSYSAAGNSSSSKSKSSGLSSQDLFNLADYSHSSNTIFQNLLKDPSVQDDVSLNDDGTYSFKQNGSGPLNDHQFMARRCHLNLNSDAREVSALGLISGHGSGRSFPLCDRLDAVNAVLECGAF